MRDNRQRDQEPEIAAVWLPSDQKHYQAYVNLDSLFQGTFVDDIASAICRVRSPRRVLVLGASLASVLLPLSVFRAVEEVTLVDMQQTESPLIERCRGLMAIRTVVTDALEYLQHSDESFDIIYADLFTNEGYADAMLDERFYSAMRARLSDSGAIVVNAFDIPSYLFPEQGETVTASLISLLAGEQSEVYFLKHRRNTLLLALSEGERGVYAHTTRPLVGYDYLRLRTALERAQEFRRAPAVTVDSTARWTSASFERVGTLLHARMVALVGDCTVRFGLGNWNSFFELALHADPLTPRFRAALSGSEMLRHIVLMELAANAFTDPQASLDQLTAILKSLDASFAFDEVLRTQALVDLHAICVCAGGRIPTDIDQVLARLAKL